MAAGHIWMAAGDPEARAGLKSGFVSRRWANREHALWVAEADGEGPPGPAELPR